MSFSVLTIGDRRQYRYAWCEPCYVDGRLLTSGAPRCEFCGDAIGLRHWLPPHAVNIKQPRLIGDFVSGVFDFVVSERFKQLYDVSGLTGVQAFYPLEVVRMGTTKHSQSYLRPNLFGVEIVHSKTRIDYDRSVTKWWKPPDSDYCRYCGPGNGGRGGTAERYEGLYLEPGTWTGEDLFQPINLCSRVLVSQAGADFMMKHNFSNVRLINTDEYGEDIFALIEPLN